MRSLPEAVVAALESDRESLNARFASRLRGGAKIDGPAFLEHLQLALAPLVTKVHERFPERTRLVLGGLYDLSLDLFTASLLGPEARTNWIEKVWQELLPEMIEPLARDPLAVAGSICNALVQISQQSGTRPQQWIDAMKRHAPACSNKSDLLRLGVVFAWQAGMVQYRSAAFQSLLSMDVSLAARLLDLPSTTSAADVSTFVDRLSSQRWLTSQRAQALSGKRELQPVATVGAFSGYGGLFRKPPTVHSEAGCLYVSDGATQWQLQADAHGAWFRKTGDGRPTTGSSRHSDVSIDRHGKIVWQKCSLAQPHLLQVTSLAVCDQTLAVTTATSHYLFLYAVLGDDKS